MEEINKIARELGDIYIKEPIPINIANVICEQAKHVQAMILRARIDEHKALGILIKDGNGKGLVERHETLTNKLKSLEEGKNE